jgi:hypothetical protein
MLYDGGYGMSKPIHSEVKESDSFTLDLFYDVDMSWSDTDTQVAFHSNLGSITVLDRMTGYGFGLRDIETGMYDEHGKFWLASGNYDIREFPELTIEEAIIKIKKDANTCNGV